MELRALSDYVEVATWNQAKAMRVKFVDIIHVGAKMSADKMACFV